MEAARSSSDAVAPMAKQNLLAGDYCYRNKSSSPDIDVVYKVVYYTITSTWVG